MQIGQTPNKKMVTFTCFFQDVDLRPAELRSAPDLIKLCNRQQYVLYVAQHKCCSHLRLGDR
jgi:hypothetical protein